MTQELDSPAPAATPDASSPSSVPASPPPGAQPPRAGVPAWLVIAQLGLVGAVAVLAWQTVDLRGKVQGAREELAQRLAQGEGASAELRSVLRQTQDALASLQAKAGALESKMAQSEGQTAALEALYQEFSRSRDDRTLAEVEQLLAVAAQQLQVAGNIEAAMIALQGADNRLSMSDRAQFLPLRAAIAHDLDVLKTAPQVDVPGLSLKLELLLGNIDTLPLAYASPPESAAPVTARAGDGGMASFALELARELWSELRQLVRIERLDQPAPVLLAPEQGTYLRENVKIRLLTARLALLARDTRSYSEDLGQAAQWLERYFDLRDEAAQKALGEIRALAGTPIAVARPGLTESFSALRAMQARMALPPAGATPSAPLPAPQPAAPAHGAQAPSANHAAPAPRAAH